MRSDPCSSDMCLGIGLDGMHHGLARAISAGNCSRAVERHITRRERRSEHRKDRKPMMAANHRAMGAHAQVRSACPMSANPASSPNSQTSPTSRGVPVQAQDQYTERHASIHKIHSMRVRKTAGSCALPPRR